MMCLYELCNGVIVNEIDGVCCVVLCVCLYILCNRVIVNEIDGVCVVM